MAEAVAVLIELRGVVAEAVEGDGPGPGRVLPLGLPGQAIDRFSCAPVELLEEEVRLLPGDRNGEVVPGPACWIGIVFRYLSELALRHFELSQAKVVRD